MDDHKPMPDEEIMEVLKVPFTFDPSRSSSTPPEYTMTKEDWIMLKNLLEMMTIVCTQGSAMLKQRLYGR